MRVRNVLETGANIAIIVIALIIGTLWVQNTFLKKRPLSGDLTGQVLKLPQAHWERAKANLVLVLRTDCHFCQESAPFYRRLTHDGPARPNVRFIAVLPDRADISREYLAHLGVNIPEVLQLPLHSLQVKGTPSILLVSNQGYVLQQWTGKLRAAQEQQVLDQLAIAR